MSYLQYGCGHDAPDSWINFDSSPTLVLERAPLVGRYLNKNARRFPACVRRGDIVRGLPVAPGSASAVYCSHTLEHLPLEDFRKALRHTWAMLKPGGVFRCVVPDLAYYIDNYRTSGSPTAAHTFLHDTMLGRETRPRGLYAWLKEIFGGSAHFWMWDYPALAHELAAAGFVDIRRAQFGDAADPRFAEVENESRWTNCLGVDCRRPGLNSPIL